MKKLILILSLFLSFQAAASAENFIVQPQNSKVKWTATKMTGKHFGTIGVASGLIEFTGEQFSGGEALIQTQSLTVDDLQGKGKAKLTAHLNGTDFFDTGKYPTAKIKITDVKPLGGNLYDVTADLTIKEVTQPVQFQAQVEKSEAGVKAAAVLKIDRTVYGIRYGSGKFFENLGDKTIHDIFTLEIEVKAVPA